MFACVKRWEFSMLIYLFVWVMWILIYYFPFAYHSRGKNPVSYATLSVRGSTMRSWLLPESLNLDALLVDDSPKKAVVPKPASAPGPSRGRGRGRGRGRRWDGGNCFSLRNGRWFELRPWGGWISGFVLYIVRWFLNKAHALFYARWKVSKNRRALISGNQHFLLVSQTVKNYN